jgi:hypothetical protein
MRHGADIAAIMSYSIKAEQYLGVAAGDTVYIFGP